MYYVNTKESFFIWEEEALGGLSVVVFTESEFRFSFS